MNKKYKFGIDFSDENDYLVLNHYGPIFNLEIIFKNGKIDNLILTSTKIFK